MIITIGRKELGLSLSSPIIKFDAINQRQFFMPDTIGTKKLAPDSSVGFMALISGAGFWSMCRALTDASSQSSVKYMNEVQLLACDDL